VVYIVVIICKCVWCELYWVLVGDAGGLDSSSGRYLDEQLLRSAADGSLPFDAFHHFCQRSVSVRGSTQVTRLTWNAALRRCGRVPRSREAAGPSFNLHPDWAAAEESKESPAIRQGVKERRRGVKRGQRGGLMVEAMSSAATSLMGPTDRELRTDHTLP
jgi:hypothetical protein